MVGLRDVAGSDRADSGSRPREEHHLQAAARRARQKRTGDATHDIAQFALLLRSVDVGVPVPAALRALEAAAIVTVVRRDDLRTALRCTLTSTRREASIFDIVFPVFWSGADEQACSANSEEAGAARAGDQGRGEQPLAAGLERADSNDPRAAAVTARATYSGGNEPVSSSPVGADPSRQIEELARRMARAIGTTRARRRHVSAAGDIVDVRDSLRQNLSHGEEIVKLRRSAPVRTRARMVVLCDVSSSMRPYTLLFLTFVHALTKVVPSVESAIFNVETSFVTDIFKRRSLRDAITWLDAQSIGLAGGTRIGHCLRSFNRRLEEQGVLRRGTTAVVLSDGWDVGDIGLLHDETARLRAQVDRMFWLDPHAAATGYQPAVRGMRSVLPFVDGYLDFSDVESLRALVRRLESGSHPPDLRISVA